MKFNLSIKILVLNVFIIVITSGSLIYFAYSTSRADLEKAIGQRLEAIAATGALMIDGDLHDQIKGEEDESSDAFLTLREELRKIKNANNLETEIYTFRREGEKLKFIVMTNEKPYIGHEYTIKEEMWPALNEGKTSHTSIYKDSHGVWLTAYAPIFDSKGQISGILDIDINLRTFQEHLAEIITRLIVVSAIILVFSIILSFILSKKLSGQLRYLTEVTEKISLGQMDRVISISSNDEVGDLAESLERMRESLKVAMSMIDDDDED